MKPIAFSVDAYAAWHDEKVASDRPLRDNLAAFREKLKVDARDDLNLLHQILTHMFAYARTEFSIAHKVDVSYQTPLQQALLASAPATSYDVLFKSVDSVINKMWRKSELNQPSVEISAILGKITDLIRTDVRTETLQSAEFLAQRMNGLPGLLYSEKLRNEYDSRVLSCAFESEMKMASGYFAYHGLMTFKAGYTVEVQIYSALMSEWRRLSHMLYEQVRIKPIEHHEFGSKESRLISLGHMLHLAECEIQRLSVDPILFTARIVIVLSVS